jgi:Holliday junction resolvasome RuvABC endonuclease subunit
VTPAQVKKAATGNSKASKDEVQDGVLRAYDGLILPSKAKGQEHICDAIAAFLAAKNSEVIKEMR